MSEGYPEEGGGGGGGFMSQRHGGIPAWVWIAGAGVLAYFLFFRNSSSAGATTTGGGGTSTTGDTTVSPGTTTVNITGPSGTSSSTGTPNPQPKPPVHPKTKKTTHPVSHKGGPAPTVTVAQWTAHNAPWNSTLGGIAAHYHTSVAELLKLNPSIKDPNVLHAGQKVRVP